MPTTPPTITPGPSAVPQRGEKTTFSARLDAFVTWIVAAVSQFVAMGANVYSNAVEAFNSASTAVAASDIAVAAAGAVQWVSGTTYAKGFVVWSPLDLRTYRRIAAGAGATDPSQDAANWRLLSQEAGLRLLGSAVVSTPVASIDFLNILTDEYESMTIELSAFSVNPSGQIHLRGAVGGVALAGASDYSASYNPNGTSGGFGIHQTDRVAVTQGYSSNSSISSASTTITIEIKNTRSTRYKTVRCFGIVHTDAAGGFTTVDGVTAIYNTGALSGFRLFPASGNFSAGTVRVYGKRVA